MAYRFQAPTSRAGPLVRLDLVDGATTYDQRALRRYGFRGVQPGTTAALLAMWELSGPAPTFFDVGANGGMFSWLCSAAFPEATVVAFEPAPGSAQAIRDVAAANDLAIRVEQVAVSSALGRATLHLSAKSDASSSLVAGWRPEAGTVEVEALSLDGYVTREQLVPDVIKIDVETHELEVLAGAAQVLVDHRPWLVIELLPERPGHAEAIRRRLEEHGYVGSRIEPDVRRGEQDDLALRDWTFFPGAAPDGFDSAFAAWSCAVARCGPPSVVARAAMRARKALKRLTAARRRASSAS